MLVTLSLFASFGGSAFGATKVINGVYYSGNENSDKVSLMINVYWGTEFLDDMLQTLRENDVKTTFFVGGIWANQETEMLKKIYAEGHEIANHGYFHKDHAKLSLEKNLKEISSTHDIVKSVLGVEMNLFAPPSGAYNKQTVEAANSLGYKTIMWTEGRDTIDWRDKDSKTIYNRAIKNCKGGDFVLMHPTKATAEALGDIIKKIKSLGFTLTTVSDNLQ